MLSARATRGLEGALLVALVAPLLWEWLETASASSRLSYALLVPALALVLALRAVRAGPGAVPRPGAEGAPRLAALLALLGAAALAGGTLSGVFTLSLCGVPLAACAWVARAGGTRALARFGPALAFLFLMVPPPMPLLDRVNPLLIHASGRTAATLLAPFDAEVVWSSPTLHFRGWTLIVAEACSGSGTFLVLAALGAFLAALFRLSAGRAAVLILCSFPLTLAVNGARIASSALVIAHFGAAAGQGLAHELLGEAVVVLGAALLALVVARQAPRVETA